MQYLRLVDKLVGWGKWMRIIGCCCFFKKLVFHEFIEFMDCVFYFGANIRIRIMPQKPKKKRKTRNFVLLVWICVCVCVFVPKSAGIPNHLDSNIHLFYMLNRYNGHISLPSQHTLNWSPKNTKEKKQ